MAHVDRCTRAVQSSWVLALAEVNGQLAVQFRRRGLWCLYPGTTPSFYDQMWAAPSKGHWVHQVLYKKWPYKIIRPPKACLRTCANCDDPIPVYVKVTTAGFAGSSCTACNLLNGVFTLVNQGPGLLQGCEWHSDFIDYCPVHERVRWRLVKPVPDTWGLYLQGEVSFASYGYWSATTAVNDCSLPVVLNYVGNQDCDSYPSSITVGPA